MRKVCEARIQWLFLEQGGRTRPPIGPRYFAVVRFEEDATLSSTEWSLVVDLNEPESATLETTALVWLLFHDHPEAPQHLLHPGSRFELCEGAQVVAKGEILCERSV